MIYNIPDLFLGDKKLKTSFLIHDYISHNQTDNAQIMLETNVISLLIEGQKSIVYPKSKITIDNDKFLVMKMGHCLMTEHLSTNGIYSSILVCFDNELLEEAFASYSKQSTVWKRDTKEFQVFPKSLAVRSYLSSLRNFRSPLSTQLERIKVEELLHLIIHENGHNSLSFLRSDKVINSDIQFKKVIETNINSRLTIEDLAFLCHMSLSSFKRNFKKIYGSTPGQWITNKRLEIAAVKLKDQNLRSSDLFYELGFETHSGFIQSFKKKFGFTPKKFQMNL